MMPMLVVEIKNVLKSIDIIKILFSMSIAASTRGAEGRGGGTPPAPRDEAAAATNIYE